MNRYQDSANQKPICDYEICYNANSKNPRWINATIAGVVCVLSHFYREVPEVIKEIDAGNVISYKNLRVRRKNMQMD